LFKFIGKFIVALNGNVKKTEIATGIAWGVLLGLVPAGCFYWIVVFVLSFLFRNNFATKLLTMTVLKLLSPFIVFFIDNIGWLVLHMEYFQNLFTTMYNMPFVPFTRFNNTLVMGGLTAGVALWLPVFIVFLPLISLYRKYIAIRVRNSKIIKTIAKSPLLKLVDKIFFQ
jgi:uncharacterized protein (TIGR03546 family)